MKRVGVLGGGQLGRMLGLAGIPLDCEFRFFDENPDSPAAAVGELFDASYHDNSRLREFSQGIDVATYEFENVPVTAVEELQKHVAVFPSIAALRTAQDRLAEKQLFANLRIPTPRFEVVDSDRGARDAAEKLGCPVVFKTIRLGYDGKGQLVIRELRDAADVWSRLGKVPLVAEQFVAFQRELSIIAVRGRDAQVVFYPLTQNIHVDGILRFSLAPAPGVTPVLQAKAESYVKSILDSFDYVGTLALELFQVGEELLANEIAPRVHNSGHWTMDGATVSQFENHLRAILGYQLGKPELRGVSGMVNLIGDIPSPDEVLAHPQAHLHLYGKTPRPGRKVGHINIVAADLDKLKNSVAKFSQYLPPAALQQIC